MRSQESPNQPRASGRPFWLEASPGPVFAVVHEPSAAASGAVAALLLPPFGWDNDNSYRARRDWAIDLADAGVPTLRIDLPGTENSAGSALDAGLFGAWTRATADAAIWLCASSGCERLVTIGIGLCGLVACEAAAAGAPVSDLVLWGTRALGRDHVRELRAYAATAARAARAASAATGATATEREPVSQAPAPGVAGGQLSVAGHVLAAGPIAALERIELTAGSLPRPSARRVLLIGRGTLAVDRRLHEAMLAAGADVSIAPGADYQRLVAPPEYGLRPDETMATVRDWVLKAPAATPGQRPFLPGGSLPGGSLPGGPSPGLPLFHGRVPSAGQTVEIAFGGARVRETIAELETADGTLLGVIAEPVHAPWQGRCLLVANTLAFRHTGPGRLHVEAARRAAAMGVASARFDLPGIGDSDGPSFSILHRTERDQAAAVAALGAVADHVAARGVAEHFVLTGICSGATIALRAASRDRRVVAVTAVNPPALGPSEAPRQAVRVGALAYEGQAGPLRWRHVTSARIRARLADVGVLWQLAHWPEARAAAAHLAALEASDARIVIVLSRQEPLARMLTGRRLLSRLRASESISVTYIGDGDHFVRSPRAQALALESILDGLADPGAAGGPVNRDG